MLVWLTGVSNRGLVAPDVARGVLMLTVAVAAGRAAGTSCVHQGGLSAVAGVAANIAGGDAVGGDAANGNAWLGSIAGEVGQALGPAINYRRSMTGAGRLGGALAMETPMAVAAAACSAAGGGGGGGGGR